MVSISYVDIDMRRSLRLSRDGEVESDLCKQIYSFIVSFSGDINNILEILFWHVRKWLKNNCDTSSQSKLKLYFPLAARHHSREDLTPEKERYVLFLQFVNYLGSTLTQWNM